MSGRRKSVLTADIPSELKVGIRAQVQGKIGVIRFVGTTSFQTGKWVGIELDDPQGKNSGVVQGKRYFECKLNHGVFVRPSQVKIINDQVESSASSNDSSPRFAPQPDPQLSRQMSASSSSTLLPSRITSPTSRLSRLPQTPTATQARKQYNKSSLTPTASVTMSPPKKKKSPQTRARSGTIGTSSLKETKLQQLRLQRLSQQQVQQQVPEQTESSADGDAEDEADDSEQPEEVETEGDGTDTIENEEYDQYVTSPSISNPPSHTSSTQYSKPNNNTNRTSSYGSLAANLPISKSEQTVPLKDFEELRLKLKILETKRQEDREKYREHEKVKEEAEQFLTLRNKLQGNCYDNNQEKETVT
jgi:dynactin 1